MLFTNASSENSPGGQELANGRLSLLFAVTSDADPVRRIGIGDVAPTPNKSASPAESDADPDPDNAAAPAAETATSCGSGEHELFDCRDRERRRRGEERFPPVLLVRLLGEDAVDHELSRVADLRNRPSIDTDLLPSPRRRTFLVGDAPGDAAALSAAVAGVVVSIGAVLDMFSCKVADELAGTSAEPTKPVQVLRKAAAAETVPCIGESSQSPRCWRRMSSALACRDNATMSPWTLIADSMSATPSMLATFSRRTDLRR